MAVIQYIIPSTLHIIFKLTFIYQVFDLPDNLLSNLVLKSGREKNFAPRKLSRPPFLPPTKMEKLPQHREDSAGPMASQWKNREHKCDQISTDSTSSGRLQEKLRYRKPSLSRYWKVGNPIIRSLRMRLLMFVQLDMNESISGSENDSQSSGDDNDPLSTLLRRKARITNENTESPYQIPRIGPEEPR